MAGYPCCCNGVVISNCSDFFTWLATKTELEITIAAEARDPGFPLPPDPCSDGDCAGLISGTYILTKIAGSFGAVPCNTAGSGRTFSYTFSESIDCAGGDNPHTGMAVDFFCSSDTLFMRLLYRYAGGASCGLAYGHPVGGGIPLPADVSSGTVPVSVPGAFSNHCVPTSALMTYAFL